MNTKTKKSLIEKFIAFLLATVLVISTMILFGCTDTSNGGSTDDGNDDNNTDTSTTVTLPIANGKFDEFTGSDKDEKTYPASPGSWTYSIDGSGSTMAPNTKSDLIHGVISVSDDELFNKTENNEKVFGNLTNPKTPNTQTDDKKNVLMIYNKKDTSIRYKSPSITIPQNSNAIISFWVKTVDVADGVGAHAFLTGGVEEPVRILNINTKTVTANNGYQKFQIYVNASQYSSKTVNLELGLGYGDSSEPRNMVKGYAFFDDVTIDYITEKDYVTKTTDGSNPITEIKANAKNDIRYDINLNGTASPADFAYNFVKTTSDPDSSNQFSTAVDKWTTKNNDTSTTAGTIAQINYNDAGLSQEVKDIVAKAPFANTDLLQISNVDYASTSVNFNGAIKIKPFKIYRLSFYVKTSEFNEGTGLNIRLTNGKSGSDRVVYGKFESIDTTDSAMKEEELNKKGNEAKKVMDNWVCYSFNIQTGIYITENVFFETNLGPFAESINLNDPLHKSNYVKGNAFITKPVFEEMTLGESQTFSGTNIATATISSVPSQGKNTISNGSFSNVNISEGINADFSGGNLYAPQSWTAYAKGSATVGGNGTLDKALNSFTHGVDKNATISGDNGIDADGNEFYPFVLKMQNDASVGSMCYRYNSQLALNTDSFYKFSFQVKSNTKISVNFVSDNGSTLKNGGTFNAGDGKWNENTDSDITVFDGLEPNNISGNWNTYAVYFKTGSKAKNFTIELWLGGRNITAAASGIAYFDSISLSTVDKAMYEKAVTNEDKVLTQNSLAVATDKQDAVDFGMGAYVYGVDYSGIDPKVEDEKKDNNTGNEDTSAGAAINWVLLTTALTSFALVLILAIVIFVRFLKEQKNKPAKVNASKIKSKYNSKVRTRFVDKTGKKVVIETDDEFGDEEYLSEQGIIEVESTDEDIEDNSKSNDEE